MDSDRSDSGRSTPLALKLLAVLGALVVVPGGAFLAAATIPTGGKVAIGVAVVWWLAVSAVLGKTLLKRRRDIRTPVRAALAVAAVASLAAAFVVTRGSTVDEQIVSAKGAEPATAADRDAALAGGGGSATKGQEPEEKSTPRKKQDKAKPDSAANNPDDAKPAAGTRSSPGEKPRAQAPPASEADAQAEPKKKAPPAPAQNTQLLSGSFRGESGHRGTGDAAVVDLAEGGRMLTFANFDVDPGAGGLRVYLHAGEAKSDDLGDFKEIARLKGTKGDQQYEIPDDLDLRRYSSVVVWCVPFSTRIAQAPLR